GSARTSSYSAMVRYTAAVQLAAAHSQTNAIGSADRQSDSSSLIRSFSARKATSFSIMSKALTGSTPARELPPPRGVRRRVRAAANKLRGRLVADDHRVDPVAAGGLADERPAQRLDDPGYACHGEQGRCGRDDEDVVPHGSSPL